MNGLSSLRISIFPAFLSVAFQANPVLHTCVSEAPPPNACHRLRGPQDNFLVIEGLTIISRGNQVLALEEELVTAYFHTGKVTDLHVSQLGGGGEGWEPRVRGKPFKGGLLRFLDIFCTFWPIYEHGRGRGCQAAADSGIDRCLVVIVVAQSSTRW